MEHLHCWCDAHKEKPHIFDFLCAEWWWKNGEDSRPYTRPLNRFLRITTAGNYWKRSGQVSRIFCVVVTFCSVVLQGVKRNDENDSRNERANAVF